MKTHLTKTQLIARLTRELYDCKQKLESIRQAAEEIRNEQLRAKGKENKQINYLAISIINAVDTSQYYELEGLR